MIKNLIVIIPTIVEASTPTKSGKFINISVLEFITSTIPNKLAPKVTGKANKKEYSVAKGLFKPLNKPATIVKPDL